LKNEGTIEETEEASEEMASSPYSRSGASLVVAVSLSRSLSFFPLFSSLSFILTFSLDSVSLQ